MKRGGEKQLIVDGDAHVARLVEGGRDRSDGGPEGAAPAQEQKLGYGERAVQFRSIQFYLNGNFYNNVSCLYDCL